ncbi:ruBisCO-associated protein-like [Abrus precatorius]|uniref:RuBisCO-associated protein-like n=1 Tax=Abrus precatorius TaxID=3816 RepID=A0A8B8K7C5_ABRPR|nr:ruBisCO-associated protein-like [Abrus precatorius]
MSSTPASSNPTPPPPSIFREYIDPNHFRPFPNNIINPNISEFHFVLTFAVETYQGEAENPRGTGHFNSTWDIERFGPADIRSLKQAHTNAKFVISIGGRGADHSFNPVDSENWIRNAECSLTNILRRYNNENENLEKIIDGIDVYYEYINSDHFNHCIGELINRLKNENLVDVVSITPSRNVLPQYSALFQDNQAAIGLVNYQFHTEDVHTVGDFIHRFYYLRSTVFGQNKLMVGFSTVPGEYVNFSPPVFIDLCQQIIESGFLKGISVWNASYSARYLPPFYIEQRAQAFLTGSDD